MLFFEGFVGSPLALEATFIRTRREQQERPALNLLQNLRDEMWQKSQHPLGYNEGGLKLKSF